MKGTSIVTESLPPAIQLFLTGLDLIGTFVFGLSGAVAAAKRGLDVFGILVLSIVAATTGGIIRDVLMGAIPPAALVDWRYLAISLTAGILIFHRLTVIDRLQSPVQLFDAAAWRCSLCPACKRHWRTASSRRWRRCSGC